MRSCAGIQNHFCCLHYLINKLNIKLQATKSNLMLRRSPWVDMIFIRRLWSYSVKVFNKLKVDWISSQYVDGSSDSVDYENIDDKNIQKSGQCTREVMTHIPSYLGVIQLVCRQNFPNN